MSLENFDLISDLHVEHWKNNIKDWRGVTTSLVAVVAGDISSDYRLSMSFIKHLSDAYNHVVFIDGNHEHYGKYHDPSENEHHMDYFFNKIPNVTYLSDSSCIIDGTAFVGTNGWWTYDFPELSGGPSKFECIEEFCDQEAHDLDVALNIHALAEENAEYLASVVADLQDNDDITNIVCITHTLPRNDLVDSSMYSIPTWAKSGNSLMSQVLAADVNKKITTWCSGHHHMPHDKIIDGIRYVGHPRGLPQDNHGHAYFPKIITL